MSTGNGEGAPQPSFEFTPPPQSGERSPGQQTPERSVPSRESEKRSPQAPPQQQQPPATPPPVTPQSDDSNAAQQQQQPIQAATSHLQADDSDLIEKEWVDRAKQIVAATQDDPFRQKSEISKAKADYIQKRFNKTIKVDDTAHA